MEMTHGHDLQAQQPLISQASKARVGGVNNAFSIWRCFFEITLDSVYYARYFRT